MCWRVRSAPEDRHKKVWDSEVPINYTGGDVSLDPLKEEFSGEGVSENAKPLALSPD